MNQKLYNTGLDNVFIGERGDNTWTIYRFMDLGGTYVPCRYNGQTVVFSDAPTAQVFLETHQLFGINFSDED